MLVLHDPTTLLHQTVELLGAKLQPALECPERLQSILKSLESPESPHELRKLTVADTGTDKSDRLIQYLHSTHAKDYLEHLETAHKLWVDQGLIKEDESVLAECFPLQASSGNASRLRQPPKDVFARAGFYAFDMSSGLAKHTWDAILASANLAIEATDILVQTSNAAERSILALCRPPGHHCDTKKTGGYCYVNNAILAVHALRSFPASSNNTKIAVLDLDFHHGNGTQDYFYESRDTLYVSIHGKDEYPYYTGFEDETGAGNGEGFNVNLPLDVGSSIEEYLEKVDVMVAKTKDFNPNFLVVSLGFDTFMLDPLGKFQIDTEDYATIGKRVRSAINGVPAAILLEGGYVVDRLGINLLSFLKGWEEGENS